LQPLELAYKETLEKFKHTHDSSVEDTNDLYDNIINAGCMLLARKTSTKGTLKAVKDVSESDYLNAIETLTQPIMRLKPVASFKERNTIQMLATIKEQAYHLQATDFETPSRLAEKIHHIIVDEYQNPYGKKLLHDRGDSAGYLRMNINNIAYDNNVNQGKYHINAPYADNQKANDAILRWVALQRESIKRPGKFSTLLDRVLTEARALGHTAPELSKKSKESSAIKTLFTLVDKYRSTDRDLPDNYKLKALYNLIAELNEIVDGKETNNSKLKQLFFQLDVAFSEEPNALQKIKTLKEELTEENVRLTSEQIAPLQKSDFSEVGEKAITIIHRKLLAGYYLKYEEAGFFHDRIYMVENLMDSIARSPDADSAIRMVYYQYLELKDKKGTLGTLLREILTEAIQNHYKTDLKSPLLDHQVGEILFDHGVIKSYTQQGKTYNPETLEQKNNQNISNAMKVLFNLTDKYRSPGILTPDIKKAHRLRDLYDTIGNLNDALYYLSHNKIDNYTQSMLSAIHKFSSLEEGFKDSSQVSRLLSNLKSSLIPQSPPAYNTDTNEDSPSSGPTQGPNLEM